MRGRKKGFKHSEETKAKMRGKRKLIEVSEENEEMVSEDAIIDADIKID